MPTRSPRRLPGDDDGWGGWRLLPTLGTHRRIQEAKAGVLEAVWRQVEEARAPPHWKRVVGGSSGRLGFPFAQGVPVGTLGPSGFASTTGGDWRDAAEQSD